MTSVPSYPSALCIAAALFIMAGMTATGQVTLGPAATDQLNRNQVHVMLRAF